MYKCSEMSECTFVSLQCCEGEDSSGGWQGPSGSCVQPEHALQVERPAHPDLTSASKPVGKNTRSHRKEKIEIWTPKSEIYSFMLNLGQFTRLSLKCYVVFFLSDLIFSLYLSVFYWLLCSQSLLASAAASAFTSSFPTARQPIQWARDAAALLRHAHHCGQQTKCNPLALITHLFSSSFFCFLALLLNLFMANTYS